ncbi:MAG: hypothetical protein J6A68_00830 [Oscillospiraceae bacterium]|nr:hypothetical protein [Oscillospiraceae bacterium]
MVIIKHPFCFCLKKGGVKREKMRKWQEMQKEQAKSKNGNSQTEKNAL